MANDLLDWFGLLARWIHVIAAIAWIGSSLFFMWMDSNLTKSGDSSKGTAGELWMVHSGGFYQVVKKYLGPGEIPPVLHWFKWEALVTWLSGFSLLLIVFYFAGGLLLVDPQVYSVSIGWARTGALGLLVFSWPIYDLLWNGPLGKSRVLNTTISILLVVGLSYLLTHTLSGRAAYIHVGAILGTLMVANVWMRILPAQRQMIAAARRGEKPDFTLGERAKQRSVHNNHMTFPVVFIMISNHFPSTYGHPHAWLVLVLIMCAGAAVGYTMNIRHRMAWGTLAGGVSAFVAAFVLVTCHTRTPIPPVSNEPTAQPRTSRSSESHGAATLRVRTKFEGTPPPSARIPLTAECRSQNTKPVFNERVGVSKGMLRDVFIWIREGLDGLTFETPQSEVVMDQQGCVYKPRIVGVRVGQPVVFLNSDAIFHNVRMVGRVNESFNFSMQTRGMRVTKYFGRPEVMIRTKCDVHPWMTSFIGVVAHPFFEISDEGGETTLNALPEGTFLLSAWHEVYGEQSQNISVAGGSTVAVEFTFRAR